MPEPAQEHDGLTPADRELEEAMRALRPAPGALDRDRLLFEAGAASGRARARRSLLAWRAAAAVVAMALGVALVARGRGGPRPAGVSERIVYVEKEKGADDFPPAPDESPDDSRVDTVRVSMFPGDDGYLSLRGPVEFRGVHALRERHATFAANEVLTARAAGPSVAPIPG